MPIRLVDGERLARSDKLKLLAQEGRVDAVAWYPWFITLALPNGSFEYNPRSIWRLLFAELVVDGRQRAILTEEEVSSILIVYQRVKLLFTWRTTDGKLWGYLTKIEATLPPVSQVTRGYRLGAPVPVKELAEFLGRPVEEVQAELAHSAAALDPRALQGPHKGSPRQGLDRYRRGRGIGGGAGGDGPSRHLSARSSSSPPAPPASAPREVSQQQKKNNQQRGQIPVRQSEQAGNYTLFEKKYRESTGRLPGGNPEKQGLYQGLCEEFGAEAVLEAVGSWAAQRGGPGQLSGNRFAMWDFLRRECAAEIQGGRAERARGNPGGSFAERLKKHTAADESTRAWLRRGNPTGSS